MGSRFRGTYAEGFAPRDFAPAHPELWKGCVGAWNPLLGPTGATLYDWSGQKRHGTLASFTLSSAWKVANVPGGGYVLSFGGSQVVTASGPTPKTPPVTLTAWVNFSSLVGLQRIVTLSVGGGVTDLLAIETNDANVLLQTTNGTTASAATGGTTLATGQWYFMAGVIASDSSRTIWLSTSPGKIFQDGTDATSITLLGNVNQAQIGAVDYPSTTQFLNGQVGPCMIYNRVLSFPELQLLSTRPGIAYEYERPARLMTYLKSSSAPGTTLLSDHFTDTNGTNLTAHTMDVGAGWTAQVGTITIQSNAAIASGANAEYVADAGQSDVTLTCTLLPVGGTAEVACIFREQDSSNFWAVSGYAGDGKLYLYHNVAGSLTSTDNGAASVTNGVSFVLTVVLSGSSIVIKKDGATIITKTDATFQTATKFGLRLWSGTSSTWDDFLVLSPGAGGTIFNPYYYRHLAGMAG